MIPESSRAWQWPEHLAVPVLDAPLVTTVLAWREGARAKGMSALLGAAERLHVSDERAVVSLVGRERAG